MCNWRQIVIAGAKFWKRRDEKTEEDASCVVRVRQNVQENVALKYNTNFNDTPWKGLFSGNNN